MWNSFAAVRVTKGSSNKGARGYTAQRAERAGRSTPGFGGFRPGGAVPDGPRPDGQRTDGWKAGSQRADLSRAGESPAGESWALGQEGHAVGEATELAPVPLARISSAENRRLPVEPLEVARVLGGGLVEGSVVLLGGEPGVGKSTLLTGLALWWVRQGIRVVYVAGEESPAQIRMRAERLGFDAVHEEGFHILPEVQLENLLETLYHDREENPDQRCVLIADSIQTLHSDQVDAYPGTPSQIRFCGGVLADFARHAGCPVFLVGHVTKSGDLAGPKLLEHMVDTVLYFEGSGGGAIRLVRAVKNRFGTTGELAVMEMRGDGLEPVDQAGVLFLSERRGVEPGSAVCAVKNGSRVFLVEIQALVSPSRYGTPQRVVQGVDSKRVALLAAILEKRAGLDLAGCDIFVKVAGGGRIDDPAADLAIATALASSLREVPVAVDTLILGEVGLTGEVRAVGDRASRLREASRYGFKRVLLAQGKRQLAGRGEGLAVQAVTSVEQVVEMALSRDAGSLAGLDVRRAKE